MIFDETAMNELWRHLRKTTVELTECKTAEDRCIVQGKAKVLNELLDANDRLARETSQVEETPNAGRTRGGRPTRPSRR